MPTHLQLEGSDLETLLARVRDEYGPRARIVKAEKVRVGGLAGFFARERFEVKVEIDGASGATAGTAPAAPATLLELTERVDEAEARAHVGLVGAQLASGPEDWPVAEPVAGPAGPAQPVAGPVGPAQPVSGPVEESRLAGPPAPAAPTAKPAFATVLADLTRNLGNGPATTFRPAVQGLPVAAPEAVTRPVTRPVTPAPMVVPALADRLLDLGVPADLVADLEPADGFNSLMRLFSRLPAAPEPPAAAGDVLVIAGDGAAAYGLAGALAHKLRVDPASVLLAAPTTLGTGVHPSRRLTGPGDARRRALRLYARPVPTLVAVDAPLDEDGAAWARDVAAELRPSAVWALVEASRKTADLRAHLDGLGRVDAIAVRGAARSADPASVLGLGVPVALLDGQPATPAAWAALLAARLDPAVATVTGQLPPVRCRR